MPAAALTMTSKKSPVLPNVPWEGGRTARLRITALVTWQSLRMIYTDSLPQLFLGLPESSAGKEPACNAGDSGSIPGLGRSPGEGKGYPLQYSGLENPMGSPRAGHDWATLTSTFTLPTVLPLPVHTGHGNSDQLLFSLLSSFCTQRFSPWQVMVSICLFILRMDRVLWQTPSCSHCECGHCKMVAGLCLIQAIS